MKCEDTRNNALRELWRICAGRPDLRKLVRQAIGKTQIEYLGTQFEIVGTDNYSEFYLWLHRTSPEHDAICYLAELLAGLTVTIVDVGANVGSFSLPILLAAKADSHLLLVEPNSTVCRRLRRNLKINKITNASIFESAISNRSEDTELYISPKGNLGLARLAHPYPGGLKKTVQCVTLPHLLAEAGILKIDLLKVDVEGFEDRVVGPLLCQQDIILPPKLIYLEDKHKNLWTFDLIRELKRHNYSMVRRFGDNIILRLDDLN